MRFFVFLCLVGLVSLAGSGCATTGPSARVTGQLDQLQSLMTGSFSSARQAAADPDNFRDVRLVMTPIWEGRDRSARWLYVEQAMADSLDRPYRQRIYRLSEGVTEGTLESAVYELPGDPLAWAGAWRYPDTFDQLTEKDLSPRSGCTIVLKLESPGVFAGSTLGSGCPSVLRGATYATSEVRITSESLTSWDRGWNSSGEQVWGATVGGYVFVRE